MVRKIQTGNLDSRSVSGNDALAIYNGLDCCVTHEVADELKAQLFDRQGSAATFLFELDFSAPLIEMMLRGVAIDMDLRRNAIDGGMKTKLRLQGYLDSIACALWGRGLNPNSPAQLKDFFYNFMALPPIYKYDKGERKLSCNRDALEKLDAYLYARPFVNLVLCIRDIIKTLGVLQTGVDSDARIRCSYNVAGTETGRLSSSGNAFGTGTNLQNITGKLRKIFISDPGYKFGYFDLEQAESRAVGIKIFMLFNDPTYLDACEIGDLHTTVSRMVWPELKWNGELKHDKKVIAGELFYREFSYRDMAKRGGHGTNYYGQPHTMAKHLKVPTPIMESFQKRYFAAFPGIRKWHHHVAKTLQTSGVMTTFMGRERQFFDRLADDTTLRQAIAFEPQSVVADIMDKGILQLWQRNIPGVQLLGQVHDAVWFQYPEREELTIVPQVLSSLSVPLTLSGRSFTIPVEALVGWNWDKESADNPDGLRVITPNSPDQRVRKYDPALPLLSRILR